MPLFKNAPIVSLLASLIAGPALAEVKAVSPRHFQLSHTVIVDATQREAWARLTNIKLWWSGSHTYSGNANNLRLDVRAGGCWCERWADGGVEHGRVVYFVREKALRIDGAFGPLQAMAVKGIMDFKLEPTSTPGQIRITLSYTANGVPESQLDQLAPVVDRVLAEQVARLATAR